MQTIISGRHLTITDAIRQYAEEKAARLPRFYDRITMLEVVADTQPHDRFKIEMILDVNHSEPLIATAEDADIYACIDRAVDRLERQLRDHKERVRDHKSH